MPPAVETRSPNRWTAREFPPDLVLTESFRLLCGEPPSSSIPKYSTVVARIKEVTFCVSFL